MKKTLALLLAFALCALAHAEPIKLTNKQADELCGALLQLPAGLGAANTTKAARNILALRPLAEAYAKGLDAARTNNHITRDTKPDAPEVAKAAAEMQKLAAEVLTIELTRFALTDEEIERAKPAPLIVATLLTYLEPKK